MGSFDAVCGLSNMAIGYDQPVVTMMIRRNPYYPQDMLLFPFDVWQPASPLVRGTYDDYGRVKIDGAAVEQWRSTQEVSRQWYSDEGMTKLDEIYTLDGERQGNRRGEPPSKYALWMAHAGVFDHLLNNIAVERWDHVSQRSFSKSLACHIDEMTENNRRLLAGEAYDEFTEGLKEKLGSDYRRAMRSTRSPWSFGSGSMTSHTPVFDHWDESIWNACDDANMAEVNRLIAEWRNMAAIMMILQSTRRLLSNPGTVGEQHGNDQPLLALADSIREQAEQNRLRFDDED